MRCPLPHCCRLSPLVTWPTFLKALECWIRTREGMQLACGFGCAPTLLQRRLLMTLLKVEGIEGVLFEVATPPNCESKNAECRTCSWSPTYWGSRMAIGSSWQYDRRTEQLKDASRRSYTLKSRLVLQPRQRKDRTEHKHSFPGKLIV